MNDHAVLLQPEDLFLLLRLRKAALEAFEPLGFTLYEAAILFQIENGVEQHNEFAALLSINPVAVSTLVTKLVRRKFVVRSFNEQDGRRVKLHLTVEGCVLVGQLKRAWQAQQAIAAKNAS